MIVIKRRSGWFYMNRQCQLTVIILLGFFGFLSVQVMHHQQDHAMHDAAEESEMLHERINKVHHPHPDKFQIKRVIIPKPRTPQRREDVPHNVVPSSRSKGGEKQTGYHLVKHQIPKRNKNGTWDTPEAKRLKEMMTIKVPPTPPLAIVSAPAPPPLPATTTMDGTAAAVVAMVAIAGRLPSSDTPVFYVKFDTTKGSMVYEAKKEWAPVGMERLRSMVLDGFFDTDISIFRCVKAFVLQFGIHGDPVARAAMAYPKIADDKVVRSNKRGWLTFATSGKNSRTTQLFFNLKDNKFLDKKDFAPIARCVKNCDVLDKITLEYGQKPKQGLLQQRGNEYLKTNFPHLDYITAASFVPAPSVLPADEKPLLPQESAMSEVQQMLEQYRAVEAKKKEGAEAVLPPHTLPPPPSNDQPKASGFFRELRNAPHSPWYPGVEPTKALPSAKVRVARNAKVPIKADTPTPGIITSDDWMPPTGKLSGMEANNLGLYLRAVADPPTGPEQCTPRRRVVWVKTHKTGSSTLTNILHRAALKYTSRVVLPKGDLFLGWPDSRNIPTSYSDIPGGGPYDMFISAHTRYNAQLIDDIVPGAEHVTLLRQPMRHFISSFEYWNVPSHIKAKSNQDVTVDQVLEDPDKWLVKSPLGPTNGLRSDRDLVINSQAFDLGLSKESSPEEVDRLISELDSWTLIMITEYMDHSLVMLSRKLCWPLRDVAYFALKFSGKNRKKAVQHRGDLISKLNWMDQKLYDHFNASLWKQIEAAPGFWEELAQLRAWKNEITASCQGTADWSEDQHRAAMLGREGLRSSVELQCHLLQLDSGGFVKYLKHWHGVPAEECPVFNVGLPQKTFIFAHPPFTDTDPFTTALHREALKKRLRLALPIVEGPNAYGVEQPNQVYKGILKNINKIPQKVFELDMLQNGRPKVGYDAIGSMAFRHFDYADLAKLIPLTLSNPEPPALIIAIQDPVRRFWRMWQDPIFQKVKRECWDQGENVTPTQFLNNPEKYIEKLPSLYKRNLQNGQSAFFFQSHALTDNANFRTRLLQLDKKVRLGVMVDYRDEAKLMLTRFMCFGIQSAAIQLPPPPPAHPKGSELLESKIRNFNKVDQVLYEHFNQSFWSKVKTQIRWEPDLKRMRELREESMQVCKDVLGPNHANVQIQTNAMLLRAAPGHPHSVPPTTLISSDIGFDCASQVASPAGFVKLFRQVLGIQHLPRHDVLLKEQGNDVDAARHEVPTTAKPVAKMIDGASCKREGPSSQLTVVVPRGINAEAALRFAYRGALKYNMAPPSHVHHAAEGNGYAAGSDGKVVEKKVNNVLHVAEEAVPSTLGRGGGALLHPELNTILVFEDPVHHFYNQWNRLFLEVRGEKEVPPMLDHFNNYDVYGREEYVRFKNPQTHALFGVRYPSKEQLEDMALQLEHRFKLVMLTTRMPESLLLARKLLCWTVSDSITTVAGIKKPPFSGVLQRIRMFNAADQYLFKHFSKRLDALIAADRSFKAALADMSSCTTVMKTQCLKIKQIPQADHLSWARERVKWPKKETCHDAVDGATYDPEMAAQTPTEQVDGCRPLYLDAISLREVHSHQKKQ